MSGHYSQNEIDTAAFEARLLEQSKGAPKEDVEALKKRVKKIKIVAYKGMSTLIYSNPDRIKRSDFEASRTLKGMSKDEVIDLVYSDKVSYMQGICYHPRNAIILYNTLGIQIGYIEICFECSTMKTESQIPKMPQLSKEGYSELKALFEHYGLIKND